MIAPVSVCHQVSTIGAVPPPMTSWYQIHDSDAREVELRRDLAAELHERADGGGRRVEDRDLVLLDELPPAARVRGVGGALVHDGGRAVGERAVDDVGVAGDPADVGRAPVDIRLGVQVEDVLVRVRRLREVAAGGVQDALRLPGGAGGVEDEERVLGVEGLGLMLGARGIHRLVPPDVALVPLDVATGALHDEYVLDGLGAVDRGIHRRLQRERLALAVPAVRGDDELRLGVVDAGAQRLGAEAAEDDRVDSPEPHDREHRDDGFGDVGEVDRDAVAVADAEGGEGVRGLLHLGREVRVGEGADIPGLALPVVGDAVAVAGEHVAVEAVVGDVELAVGEPLRDGRVGPVEHGAERFVPVEALAGLVTPEGDPVGSRPVVECGLRDRGRREGGARREPALFVEQVVDRVHNGLLPRLSGPAGRRCRGSPRWGFLLDPNRSRAAFGPRFAR
jgi:hypothetical protein